MRRIAAGVLGILYALLLGGLLTLGAVLFVPVVLHTLHVRLDRNPTVFLPALVGSLVLLGWLVAMLAAAVGEEVARRFGHTAESAATPAGAVRYIASTGFVPETATRHSCLNGARGIRPTFSRSPVRSLNASMARLIRSARPCSLLATAAS
jgi:hypothetical protein